MKASLCLIILFFALAHVARGGILKGKVIDEKGEALPYATIYVEGTTVGTNANGNGVYELTLSPGLYKVMCQFIGYEQGIHTVDIRDNEVIEYNFVLHSQSLQMKEVVIDGNAEDRAYGIIRQAIKKRKEHLDQVKSFQTSIYLKGVMRSRQLPGRVMGQKIKPADVGADSTGKGVLYLLEEDADYYATDGNERTVIHTVRESGNPGGVGFSRFPPVITFYENNVPLLGKASRGFVSPISDLALNYYKYKFLGEFNEKGHTIYKIQVIQKRNFEPCFNGYIYIVDGDFAIHSLNLTLVKESGLDMLDTLKVDQLFLPLEKDTWVIKSQVLYIAINILGFDITGSGVTVYNKQRVNEPIPDTMFAGNVISSYDKKANKKDTAYWLEARPIPLEADEKKDYVLKDSLNKIDENPVRKDSIRRRGNRFKPFGFALGGYTYSSKEYKNVVNINSLLLGIGSDNIVNFNVVEGFNIAPKVKWRHMLDTGKYLFADAAIRYGFSNTHFNAIGRIYYMANSKEWIGRGWLGGIEGGKYVFQYNPENPVLPWFNTYSTLIYRESDLKLYERWEASSFLRRNYGNGLNWYIRASYQQRLPLENTTDYSFWAKGKGDYAANITPHLVQTATAWEKSDAALIHASVSYKPGFTYTQYPDYKVANGSAWPRLTLVYDKGIPDLLNSKVNFDKWRFNIHDDVRLRLLGNLSYNLAAGGFINSAYVSVPDLMHLYGARGIGYAAPYLSSFQFAQYYAFSNKEPLYGEVHLEYHLNGLLSNKIPLLRQAQWYLLVGTNTFYAGNSDHYYEAFVGIDNIGWKLLRILRIDFVQSWDSYMGHNSGIRFGLNSKTLTVAKNTATESEW